MLDLTLQERKAILFLCAVALLGIGINFALKFNSKAAKLVALDTAEIKINLNRATLDDFLRTKTLPEKLARALIAYRDEHGPFDSLEQVKEIKGIGESRYKKIEEYFYAG